MKKLTAKGRAGLAKKDRTVATLGWRISCKLRRRLRFGVDDYLICLGFVSPNPPWYSLEQRVTDALVLLSRFSPPHYGFCSLP